MQYNEYSQLNRVDNYHIAASEL